MKKIVLLVMLGLIWFNLPSLETPPQNNQTMSVAKASSINKSTVPKKTTRAIVKISDERENLTQTNYQCGEKSKCSQMRSCGEAMFYLHHCNMKRMDRDKDAIPCETRWCNKKSDRF